MNIMTKRGQLDNIITYQHICDTNTDMPNIPSDQITLGSVCIVLQGESDGLQVYIASSQKQWQAITTGISGGGSGGESSLQLYVCNTNEYSQQTGTPTISTPNSNTIYLVPNNNENDLYTEWIYINNSWQHFGNSAAAQAERLNAEAWAVGKRNGTNVSSNDPTYHNNAKYYAEQAFSGTPEGYAALVGDVGDLKSAMDDQYDELVEVRSYLRTNSVASKYSQDTAITSLSINSSKHLIDFATPIPSGTKITYKVVDEGGVLGGAFAVYEDGSNIGTNKLKNTEYENTTASTVSWMSIYAPSVSSTGTLRFEVNVYAQNDDSIENRVKNVETSASYSEEVVRTGKYTYTDIVNGTWGTSGALVNSEKRLRPAELIKVSKGDQIVIKTGTLIHAVGIWVGTPSASTITRNDSSFITTNETITIGADGYFIVSFAKTDTTATITSDDYDAAIEIYNSVVWQNQTDIAELQDQVREAGNLHEFGSNVLASFAEKTYVSNKSSIYDPIYTYTGTILSGDIFSTLIESIVGTTSDNPWLMYLRNGDTTIRSARKLAVTDADIQSGADNIVVALFPAYGIPLPTGTATYTNIRIVKGEMDLYNLTGKLRNAVANTTWMGAVKDIPEYFLANGYLEKKAHRINELGEHADDVFVFITDAHWEYNARNSPALINYLQDKCTIQRLFDGGDLMNGIYTEALNMFRQSFRGKIYRCCGNHEWALPNDAKNLYYWYDSLNNDQIGSPYGHYWYVENVQQKIRYIILNPFRWTGGESGGWDYSYDIDQVNWFTNVALGTVPAGYDVIVFTHWLRSNESHIGNYELIETAIANFNADTSTHGRVICVFEGHAHWDSIFRTPSGVPVLLTTCDKYNVSNEPELSQEVRTLGTINEQVFEVSILNRTEKTITLVRIGALAQDNVDISRTLDGAIQDGFSWVQKYEERIVHYEPVSVTTSTTLEPSITPTSWNSTNTDACTVNSSGVVSVGAGETDDDKAYICAKNAAQLEVWIAIAG